jgi:phosphatidylinositol phospholipase C, beta
VRKLVVEQMSQWSEVVERQQREKWETLRLQLKDNQDVLRKLMEGVQAAQMKQLEAKHERYIFVLSLNSFSNNQMVLLAGTSKS